MNLKQVTIGFVIVWAFHLLLCAGCASRQVKVALNYAPTGTGLLSDLKPAVVSLQVVDHRPKEQRNYIGVQRNTMFGAENTTVISKTPEVQVVHNALKVELERSGHRVLNPGHGHGEITVNVGLTQFFFDSKASGVDIELVGSIRADVVASAGVGNVPQVSFTVESSYRDFVQMGLSRPAFFGVWGIFSSATSKSHIEKVLNGTLVEFVRRFCLEPKFRKFFI